MSDTQTVEPETTTTTDEESLPIVEAGTDKHSPAVQEYLRRGGMSQATELTEAQATNLQAAIDGKLISGRMGEKRIRSLIEDGPPAASNGNGSRSKYPEATRAMHKRAVTLTGGPPPPDGNGPVYPVTVKQVALIAKLLTKAGGDPYGAVGMKQATLKRIAKGEKLDAKVLKPLREWTKASPDLASDKTMYARKAAACVVAFAEGQDK